MKLNITEETNKKKKGKKMGESVNHIKVFLG